MNAQERIDTARTVVAGDKRLLAMDECISGAILCDETIRQQKKGGTPFVKAITDAGIIPGMKVDSGAKDMAGHPGEKITEGLDGLRDRLAEYSHIGARFAKWRAVVAVSEDIPCRGCIEANAQALACYAALCQEAGLVPVVEPEVLMEGDHTLERCCEVTEEVLRTVFNQLYTQRVTLEGMILKPNMVLPGLTCPTQEAVDDTATGAATGRAGPDGSMGERLDPLRPGKLRGFRDGRGGHQAGRRGKDPAVDGHRRPWLIDYIVYDALSRNV